MTEFEKNNFANFEASKAMKDIVFDDAVFGVYKEDGELELGNGTAWYSYKFNPEITIAPLFQQARKWFREKHNIGINVIHNASPFEYYDAWLTIVQDDGDKRIESCEVAKSEPDAYNAAIIKACQLVKEKK